MPNKSTAKSPTPKTLPPEPRAKPETFKRELTDFQLLVCDLAGDIILNGGHQDDVHNLIFAAMGHSYRLRFGMSKGSPDEYLGNLHQDWIQKISRHWPEERPEPKEEKPKTVSEMVRTHLRDGLRSNFEWFLGSARMHELYLLWAVLQNFEGVTHGPESERAESVLALAFAYEIDSDSTYVKVSRDRVKLVEQYVGLLEAAETRREDHSGAERG